LSVLRKEGCIVKKLVALAFVLAILAGGMVGCGDSKPAAKPTGTAGAK